MLINFGVNLIMPVDAAMKSYDRTDDLRMVVVSFITRPKCVTI